MTENKGKETNKRDKQKTGKRIDLDQIILITTLTLDGLNIWLKGKDYQTESKYKTQLYVIYRENKCNHIDVEVKREKMKNIYTMQKLNKRKLE